MRKIVLFIIKSLDGYIADKNGNVDGLSSQGRIERNQIKLVHTQTYNGITDLDYIHR